ncbi:MAG: NAD(P)H-dependent glycerol-3-phosphate dehydrogenase [Pyramidobacter sp.]|nr:NAD(P)H-dependent glycerol-3-phosphate dehydrogenase [Pyramidobacter sp.]
MNRSVTVFGAGSWGTALAQSLARSGNDVCLWCHVPEHARAINQNGYNPEYLTDYQLSPHIQATCSLEEASAFSDLWLFVTPTQFLRSLLERLRPYFRPGIEAANAAKGMEISSLKQISQIFEEVFPDAAYTVISGPSHAEEAIRDLPLALVAASEHPASAMMWQDIFNRENFRVYTNQDVIGVEVGGAVKNVIAIASGFLYSMEMGDNATAAMVTRGLAEVVRLGCALGGKVQTFAGLAGVGDLMVTAYSRHSRNFRLGEMIGEGLSLDQAIQKLGQVAEGAYTVKAVKMLSEKIGVDMPISEAVWAVLYDGLEPRAAVKRLLSRDPKPEY